MDQAGIPQGLPPSNRPPQYPYYEIRVLSQLDSTWSVWFDGLAVMPQENGQTLIAGPVQDQAALLAILTKVFNLKLILLSVRRIEAE